MYIGLRHDIDNEWAITKGVPKIIALEKKYNVKSTFFTRVDALKTENSRSYLLSLQDEGWEIALHLINTIDSPAYEPAIKELETLKSFGFRIRGVSPCGKTIGFKGEQTWRVMDRLRLDYMCGYNSPVKKLKTYVMPNHLSFDIHYVRKYGEIEGYKRFLSDLNLRISKEGHATVLVHPEWFVRSVGKQVSSLLMYRMYKILYTLMKKNLMNRVYEKFLEYGLSRNYIFMPYIELKNHLAPK